MKVSGGKERQQNSVIVYCKWDGMFSHLAHLNVRFMSGNTGRTKQLNMFLHILCSFFFF